jgi:multidrug transporter EmrE-like cation transporter
MSNISAASLLATSAVLMGISNLCLKSSIGRVQSSAASMSFVLSVVRQPIFLCGFLLFGFASVIYMRVLTSISLSTAYPVFVGIAFAVVAVGAMVLFGERLSAPKLLGAALLIAGIAFISRG